MFVSELDLGLDQLVSQTLFMKRSHTSIWIQIALQIKKDPLKNSFFDFH